MKQTDGLRWYRSGDAEDPLINDFRLPKGGW